MEDKIFKSDAKAIVDTAFDSKLFKDTLTRDDFNSFEELIEYMLKSRFEAYKKLHVLIEKVEKINQKF